MNVGAGSYAFRCLFEDFSAITGPTVTVAGHARGTTAIAPITTNDLLAPARTYHGWIAAGLETLAGQTTALAADVRGGNLGQARSDWLTAHLTYERLGAAYDAFGDFDGEINGTTAGLDGGVNSPGWTGFYRLEYGLWHGQSARQLTGNAYAVNPSTGAKVPDPGGVSTLNSAGLGTVYGDPDPAFDGCSDASHTSANPLAEAAIGHTDQANHEYDLTDFSTTLKDGNMPAVSFLKAAEYQDGHPGYSDPLDEQAFLVNTVNQIEKSKFWSSTAIVITYDDSDGWYDHQAPKIVNGSNDASLDAAICSSTPIRLASIPVRCGYSQRLPMLVISPWSKANYVNHKQPTPPRLSTSSKTTGSAGSGSGAARSTRFQAA